MAGRRRRRSASTASTGAPVDESRVGWVKESSMLKPIPENSIDDSDCPIFVMTDATIYRKDGRTLGNPLLVHVEGPLIVRGHVIVDDDLSDRLVKRSLTAAHMEVPHSVTYSIGDPATLWVAGAAGWYEIRPSTEYQRVYDQVVEATTLYYGVFDAYEKHNLANEGKKKSKRLSPPTLDQALFNYAKKAANGIILDEAIALCHKWAEFLIFKFTKEPALVWDTTPFAKQMRSWYPERALAAAKGLVAPPPVLAPSTGDNQEPDKNNTTQSRRSRSARASSRRSEVGSTMSRSRSPQPARRSETRSSKTETPVPLPEQYRHLAQAPSSRPSPAANAAAASVAAQQQNMPTSTGLSDAHSEAVDRLISVCQEIASESNIKKSTASAIIGKIYFRCKMRQPPKEFHYKSAVNDICSYYAKDILARLGPEWDGTEWRTWCEETAAKPWKPVMAINPEDFPAQTFRRAKAAPKPAASATPAFQVPPTINLKSSRLAQPESDAESETDQWVYNAPPPRSQRSGKGARLTTASASKKRPHSELDDRGSHRGKKHARLSHLNTDDDDDFEDANASDEDIPAVITLGSQLPLPEGTTRLVIRAERIPSTTPSGPEGTWTCEQEGCNYVVREADEQDSQKLIQAHFRDHEARAEKVDLAVRESRGQMPINYLLNKIQDIGKAVLSKKQATVNGKPVPAPVKRRLLA